MPVSSSPQIGVVKRSLRDQTKRLMTDETTEPKTDFFKLAVAILIAVVAVTAAVGGGRAGFLNTEDGELTRTGVLNKTRQSQINLSHQLTAMDQALYAQQFIEQERLADLTRQGAVEARQQGRPAEARALEAQADANTRLQGHLRNFFYSDYRTSKDGYDETQLNADLKLTLVAREYRGLQPEAFINRGDARGALAIDLMLALVVTAGSLLLFALADMSTSRIKYAYAGLGAIVLAIGIFLIARVQ
jgi:hypothetical protein